MMTYKPSGDDGAASGLHVLHRTMGGVGALLITLSGLSPTIGVFVVGSDIIHQAGAAAVLCFAAAALLGVAIAATYAELASAFPETGGEYTIVGRAVGPAWGFAMLGLNILTFSISPALTGLGVATYLQVVAPGLAAVPVAVSMVVAVTACAILNVRVNARITGAFLAIELAVLVVVTALGLGHVHRNMSELLLHPMALGSGGGLRPASLAVIGAGVAGAIYAFDGYGSAVYLGEELRDAPRRVARVVFWALGLATVALLVPVFAVTAGAPDLAALVASAAPVPAFVMAMGGRGLAELMSLGVALALFNAMIAIVLMSGRQLYGSGRDRAWPALFSRALARIHPRFNSPWVATLVMGATSVGWCFVDLKTLVVLIGDGTAAIYAGMCVAAIAGRRSGITAHAAFHMPGYPLLPCAALAAISVIAIADLFDADGRAGLISTLAVVAASVVYYLAALRGRAAWAHRGPSAAPSGESRSGPAVDLA